MVLCSDLHMSNNDCAFKNCFSIAVHCTVTFPSLNPTAPRKAKIVCNFGLSECNRVKTYLNGKALQIFALLPK